MAILKMERIHIYGLHSDRKAILEELQKRELVEVCAPETDDLSFPETSKSIAQFEKYMQEAEAALAALNEFASEKTGFFSGKRGLPIQRYHMASADSDAVLHTVFHINELAEKIRERRAFAGKTSAGNTPDAPEEGHDSDPEIQRLVAGINEHIQSRRDIELFYDHLALRRDKYHVLSKTGLTEYTFFIEGYIPKKYADGIKSLLESKYTVYLEFSEPDEGAPVAFANNTFSAPVEGITETYSMPSSSDVDPNPVMAFFYYLFFGMMFSDAGYGLLLMIVCGFLGFGRRLEKSRRNNFRMFFFCGVSTVFWGLMYGGFFGNIIYTVSTAFFGREVAFVPIWLDPISRAMELLVFSVALGVIQILIGMGIKFYVLCRQKRVADAVCDVGFWMIILLGICSIAAGMGLQAPELQTAGTWISAFGAAGLLITGGRKSKSLIGKIFGGVAGLYDITGYVSDALSYCRLMALGLATGAIANVANMLGAMFGGGIIGVILFVVIAAFGHSLNFAMNMLGAYVHTNRLQYVEFFSKFYEGGGRKFEPFRMNTKYHYFSEENTERK